MPAAPNSERPPEAGRSTWTVADGWLRQVAVLAGLAALVSAAAGIGGLPRWPGLAHLVALPPLDLTADLRVLVAEATGYPSLLLGMAASLAIRSAVLAVLLGGLSRGRFLFALRFYLAVLPITLLAALFSYAGHAGLYSGLHWIGMGLALLALLVMAPAPWTGHPCLGVALRQSWRDGLRVWPVLAYAGALVVLGGVAFAPGPVIWVVAVPASAALTFAALRWLSRPAGGRPKLRLAAAVGALAAGAVAFVSAAEPGPDEAGTTREGSLMAMSGMNSTSGGGAALEVDYPRVFGFACEQVYYFSYAGPGQGQPQDQAVCPIRTGAPYTEEDTRRRPFAQHVGFLAAQVDDLPEPVTLLAHSQGAWVAWQAAAEGRLEGVDTLVVIGPFPDSALGWPPPGEPGAGRVGADFIAALQPLTRLVDFEFHPYEQIAREILEDPSVPREIYSQPLPTDLEVLSVFGLGDLALNPAGWHLDGATDACPVIADHPDLPLAGGVQRQINAFLDGQELAPCPRWRELVHPVSMPWKPPPAEAAAAYDR